MLPNAQNPYAEATLPSPSVLRSLEEAFLEAKKSGKAPTFVRAFINNEGEFDRYAAASFVRVFIEMNNQNEYSRYETDPNGYLWLENIVKYCGYTYGDCEIQITQETAESVGNAFLDYLRTSASREAIGVSRRIRIRTSGAMQPRD